MNSGRCDNPMIMIGEKWRYCNSNDDKKNDDDDDDDKDDNNTDA